jgi:hypothetical protein
MIHQYDVVELRTTVGEWSAGTRARVVATGPGFVALRRRGDQDDVIVNRTDVTVIHRGDRPPMRPVLRAVA